MDRNRSHARNPGQLLSLPAFIEELSSPARILTVTGTVERATHRVSNSFNLSGWRINPEPAPDRITFFYRQSSV